MATKNIVPRADGEGELGTSSKKWSKVQAVTGSFDHIQTTTMATEIYTSGSTKFGDTSDDTHQFTGSVLTRGTTFSVGTANRPAFIADGNSTNEGDYVVPVGTHLVMGEHANDGNPGGLTTHLKIEATTGDVTVYNNLSASLNISASAFYGDGQYLDNVGGTPGGSSGEVQYNDSGSFTGSAKLTFDDDGGSKAALAIDSTSPYMHNSYGGLTINGQSGGLLEFQKENATKARIYSTGDDLKLLSMDGRIVLTPDTASQVEIAGNLSASLNISASAFYGDGSGLTGVTGEWDGTHDGNAEITGSLTMEDSSGIFFNDSTNGGIATLTAERFDVGGLGWEMNRISMSSSAEGTESAGFHADSGTSDGSGGGAYSQVRMFASGSNGGSLSNPAEEVSLTLRTPGKIADLDGNLEVSGSGEFGGTLSASGEISAPSFDGDINVTMGSDNANYYPIFATGFMNQVTPSTDVSLKYNPATNKMTIPSIESSMTIDATEISASVIHGTGLDRGTKTADFNIDCSATNTHEFILSGAVATTLTASFSNVKPYATYQLIHKVGKDNMAIYFDESIYWPGGTRPTLSTASGSIDVLTFTTDGNSNLYGVAQFNFSASVG